MTQHCTRHHRNLLDPSMHIRNSLVCWGSRLKRFSMALVCNRTRPVIFVLRKDLLNMVMNPLCVVMAPLHMVMMDLRSLPNVNLESPHVMLLVIDSTLPYLTRHGISQPRIRQAFKLLFSKVFFYSPLSLIKICHCPAYFPLKLNYCSLIHL